VAGDLAPLDDEVNAMSGLIDVHQHVVPQIYIDEMAKLGVVGSGEGRHWPQWSVPSTLELMDRTGIAATVGSIASPGLYFGDIAFTRRIARPLNESITEIVQGHPKKFGGFGVVPLPDTAASCAELGYLLDALKLDGICLLTNFGGKYLGDPSFDEFMAECDRREAIVFLHPGYPARGQVPQYDAPKGTLELTYDTGRAIANMLWNGTLSKYPRIRWIVSHAGGVIPFLMFRVMKYDHEPNVRERNPEGVAACLKRFWYDVAQSAVPPSLRALYEIADPGRIVFGSDYPFARFPEQDLIETRDGLAAFDGFDAAFKRKIERDNAVALFPKLG
jgi:predicted TIM-barrel fold metal-dependent hydrolase